MMPEWLARRAYLTPDGLALFYGKRWWTFAELDAAAKRAARRLRVELAAAVPPTAIDPAAVPPTGVALAAELAHVTPAPARSEPRRVSPSGNCIVGPRVAVLLPNSATFVVWVHAAAKAAAVLVPLNARLTPAEMAWQLDDAGASVLVHDDTYADVARAAAHGRRVRLLNVSALGYGDAPGTRPGGVRGAAPGSVSGAAPGTAAPPPAPPPAPQPAPFHDARYPGSPALSATATDPVRLRERISLGEVHSIVYTSGTTGQPKGAVLTYGNHWWSATGSVLNLGLVPGDRWLACMPLFHVGGLAILLRSVIYGIPVFLHDKFDPGAVHDAIDRHGVSLLSVVAAMLERMLDARGHVPYPPSLRAVLLGGGPAPQALLRRAAKVRLPVLQTYGLTEAASQVATLAPEEGLRKLGSAGKPLFPTEVRIVRSAAGSRAQGEDSTKAEPGQLGEIAVAGPTVTPGYWRRPDETAAVLQDGWLHTGDVGYVDDDGYLYVVDRRDDMFVSGGENVYPAEIEAVLREHELVSEVAVVGVPDERWGRVPAAAVVLREDTAGPSFDPDDAIRKLRTFCRTRLAGYKVPAHIVFLASLPRNATGKVMRRRVGETVFSHL